MRNKQDGPTNREALPTETSNVSRPGVELKPIEDPILARWVVERFEKLEADKEYLRALHSITNLQQPAVQTVDFSPIIQILVIGAVHRGGIPRNTWKKLWTLGTGKSWEALKDLPDRIQRMARAIEGVNKSQFFAPSQFANAETTVARVLRGRFSDLPVTLDMYAEALRLHIERIPKLTAKIHPTPAPGEYSELVFQLSRLVKAITGSDHDRQVADLLNSAANALGEKNFRLDPLDLNQARYRRRKAK